MDSGIAIKMIKDLLKKAIQKYAKQLESSDQVTDLVISAKNPEGEPQIHVYNNGVFVKEILVTDLYSRFDLVAMIPGIDLKTLIPEYLTRFILRVANEKGIDIQTPSFGIMLQKDTLCAVMYISGKLIKFSQTRTDIPLEYILQTN
jgi:hypothetical protein